MANDELALPADAPHATIVVAVLSATANRVVTELRRDALRIDLATADVLRAPALPLVYVFWFDAPLGIALSDRVVAWANAADPRAGVIGLIENGGSNEREVLLAAGFDDVLAGALSSRELGARIRAVHRRMHWSTRTGRVRYAAVTLDLDNHMLWADGKTISLTSIELAVMRELIKAAGRPLSRAALLDAAWGAGELEISERAVDNVILRLRRKLPRPEMLETVRSIGFRLTS